MTTTYALILAAGRGARFSTSGSNKVFTPLGGRPMLRWSVEVFDAHPGIDGIVVVGSASEYETLREVLQGLPKVIAIVPGGESRQESVCVGLFALGGGVDDMVLVHDGARPLVTSDIIDRCLESVHASGSAVAAVPVTDTLKSATAERVVLNTVNRDGLWSIQTPQAFLVNALSEAQVAAREVGFQGTDEASLMERFGEMPVHLVLGSPENMKVTHPQDLALAEAILSHRQGTRLSETRVGFGYDIHRFTFGRPLMLGGVRIPDEHGRGLDGHSDADVLLHAICDALLGAAGLRDIGTLFPNTDAAFKDIASTRLLQTVAERITELGYRVINVDATVIAESPKINPYVPEIQSVISEILGIESGRIGIKATTHEGLGALGAEQGIAAHAVASITT